MNPRDLTQDEMKRVLMEVAPVTFKYAIRRIKKCILENDEHADVSLNSFLSLVCAIMASHDANMMRWMESFYYMQIGEPLDADRLRTTFTKNLYENN